METKQQVSLNGIPLWKCKQSELTKFCKENGIESAGLKDYQIATLVKKHLTEFPEKMAIQETAPILAKEPKSKVKPKAKAKAQETKGKGAKKLKSAPISKNKPTIETLKVTD